MEIHINNSNQYSNILTPFQQLSTWITLHHKELRMNKIQIMVKLLHNHQQNMAVPVHVVIRKILLEEIVSYSSKRTTTLITIKLLMH